MALHCILIFCSEEHELTCCPTQLEPMAGRQSRLRPLPNSPSSTSLNAAGEQGSNGATPGGSTGKAAAAGELKSRL
jgi:hypothetical protein